MTMMLAIYYLRRQKAMWQKEGVSLALLRRLEARHRNDWGMVQWVQQKLLPVFAAGAGGEENENANV
jgi:hypothetical protein